VGRLEAELELEREQEGVVVWRGQLGVLQQQGRHWVASGLRERVVVGEVVVQHVRPVLLPHLLRWSMVAALLVLGPGPGLEQERVEAVGVLGVQEVVAEWVLLDTEHSILSSFGRQQSGQGKVCNIQKNKMEHKKKGNWRDTN